MNLEAFSDPGMRQLISAFGTWLPAQMRPHKAALMINAYMSFFQSISETWGRIPSYEQLLERFGADGLRRMRVPMSWLAEAHGMSADVAAKLVDSEQRTILRILAEVPPGACNSVLQGYHEYLQARRIKGSTSLRSIRLALRPAANLLLIEKTTGHEKLPTTLSVQKLLKGKPGCAAALTGFINYLNEYHHLGIKSEHSKQLLRRYARQKLEHELFSLMKEAAAGVDVQARWVPKGLHYFHDVARVKASDISEVDAAQAGGITVIVRGQKYWLPGPCDPFDGCAPV